MPQLQWSDALVFDLPAMDHTNDHFGQEDRWMQGTRFSSTNCHSVQHKVVLQVMREGIALSEAGDPGAIRQMARELAIWFPQHAQNMDAALALHLRSVGFDPLTGTVALPQALPAGLIHGCGGASCSDSETGEPAAQAA